MQIYKQGRRKCDMIRNKKKKKKKGKSILKACETVFIFLPSGLKKLRND